MPRAILQAYVQKIVQAPGEILIMHEIDGGMTRQIYTDGRPLPKDPSPSWQGYSVGTWEGDVLVVQTIGFNGKSPIDGYGHPRSEHTKITERYRRRDVGHLDVDTTFDDPRFYNKPCGRRSETRPVRRSKSRPPEGCSFYARSLSGPVLSAGGRRDRAFFSPSAPPGC
jgi:hypothetical protein